MNPNPNPRLLEFDGPPGTDGLEVEQLSGEEGLSRLFHFTLHLVAPHPVPGLAARLLLKEVGFRLRLADDTWRQWRGVVSSLVHKGRRPGEESRYEVEVVPWLWKLTRESDCRIFLDRTAPQIVAALAAKHGHKGDVDEVLGQYPTHECRTQYRETDFAFWSRLLEQEGIFYWFRHDGPRPRLVLGDSVTAFGSARPPEVPLVPTAANLAEPESVHMWNERFEARSERCSLADTDPSAPLHPVAASLPTQQNGQPVYGHTYEFPGGFRDAAEAARYAKVRMEEEELPRTFSTGSGSARWFAPGLTFRIAEAEVPQRLTGVRHMAVDLPGRREYANEFQCVPADVAYRPQRVTGKPTIHGPQTAVVVGPMGAAVGADGMPFHTEAAGRVRVRFPWDRHRDAEHEASAWVRVAHSWLGAFLVHRINHQVVVQFEGGDPDRPIVTGIAYDTAADLPFDPVAHPERTTWWTSTAPGDARKVASFICLDAAAGAEAVVISSQRDSYFHATRDQLRASDRDTVERVGGRWAVAADNGAVIDGGPLVRLDGDRVVVNATEIVLVTPGGSIRIGPDGIEIKGVPTKINCSGAAPDEGSIDPPVPKLDAIRVRYR